MQLLMKCFLTSVFLSVSLLSFAQSATSSIELVGTWDVQEVILPEMNMDEEQQLIMESLKAGFSQTSYEFKADNAFDIHFQEDVPATMTELTFLKNTQWKYDESTQIISIGTPTDNYSLMGLQVILVDEFVFFLIEESSFSMKMLKSTK